MNHVNFILLSPVNVDFKPLFYIPSCRSVLETSLSGVVCFGLFQHAVVHFFTKFGDGEKFRERGRGEDHAIGWIVRSVAMSPVDEEPSGVDEFFFDDF